MLIRYGPANFNGHEFSVFGESLFIFVMPSKLTEIIRQTILWVNETDPLNVLSNADLSAKEGMLYARLDTGLESLNAKLDVFIEDIQFEIDFDMNLIHIRFIID